MADESSLLDLSEEDRQRALMHEVVDGGELEGSPPDDDFRTPSNGSNSAANLSELTVQGTPLSRPQRVSQLHLQENRAANSLPDVSMSADHGNARRHTASNERFFVNVAETMRRSKELEKENYELKSKVWALREEMPQYKDADGKLLLEKITELHVKLEEKKSECKEANEKADKLSKRLDAIERHNKNVEELEQIIGDLRGEISRLKTREVAAAEEKALSLERHLEEIRNGSMSSTRSNLNFEIDRLDRENLELRADIAKTSQTLAALETKYSELQAELQKKTEEVRNLEALLRESEKNLDKELKNAEKLHKAYTAVDKARQDLQKQYEALMAEHEKMKRNPDDIMEKLLNLSAQNQQLKLQCQMYGAKARARGGTVEVEEGVIASFAADFQENEELMEQLKSVVDQCRDSVMERPSYRENLDALLAPDSPLKAKQDGEASRRFSLMDPFVDVSQAADLYNMSVATTQDLREAKTRITSLHLVCKRLFERLKASARLFDDILVELGGETEAARRLSEQIRAMSLDLDESLTVVADVQQRVAAAERSFQEMHTHLETSFQMSGLMGDVSFMNKTHAMQQVSRRFAELENEEREKMTSEILELKSLLDEAQKKLIATDNGRLELIDEVKHLQSERDIDHETYERAIAELEEVKRLADEEREKRGKDVILLEKLREEIHTKTTETERLVADVNRLLDEKDELTKRIEEHRVAVEESEKLHEHVARVERELEQATKKLAETEKRAANAAAAWVRLKKENDALEEKNRELQKAAFVLEDSTVEVRKSEFGRQMGTAPGFNDTSVMENEKVQTELSSADISSMESRAGRLTEVELQRDCLVRLFAGLEETVGTGPVCSPQQGDEIEWARRQSAAIVKLVEGAKKGKKEAEEKLKSAIIEKSVMEQNVGELASRLDALNAQHEEQKAKETPTSPRSVIANLRDTYSQQRSKLNDWTKKANDMVQDVKKPSEDEDARNKLLDSLRGLREMIYTEMRKTDVKLKGLNAEVDDENLPPDMLPFVLKIRELQSQLTHAKERYETLHAEIREGRIGPGTCARITEELENISKALGEAHSSIKATSSKARKLKLSVKQ